MALIIPKNNADAQTLDATLKIYYDANDWVQNAVLINKLSAALDDLGIEDEKKEPQSYTKKTQVLAYFGFITWQDVTNSQSARRITALGRRFYEARLSGNTDRVLEVLIESLSTCTFGRNVIGCDSDSDIEAPNVFIKASLLLGGLNNNEFAFILGKMELSGVDFSDAIFQIKVNRLKDLKTYPADNAKKWNDPKPITALKNWGFFNSDDNTISDKVLLKYSDALINLRIKNTETVRFVSEKEDEEDNTKDDTLQKIFYGAPGTGKSHRIKEDEGVKRADEKNLVFRTTFHPDSDYSTFVGAYKPTIRPVADKYKAVAGKDEEITYSFVPQAFLQAYVAAWEHQEENVYLIIEEINRGNCAQIFGDLFQLLDRDGDGYSEYPIMADRDLAKFLNGKDENDQDILANKNGIKDGKLCLPKNLYIWATMNTSDQSLFPIDSAFKRRWEWVYVPIDTKKETWYIKVGENHYSWTSFLDKVNDELLTDETAEDKHLGFYFCKATEKREDTENEPNVITAQTFVGKVLFYLWNDVFKVYGIPAKIGSSKDWPYRKFYQTNGEVDETRVTALMEKLGIKPDSVKADMPSDNEAEQE